MEVARVRSSVLVGEGITESSTEVADAFGKSDVRFSADEGAMAEVA